MKTTTAAILMIITALCASCASNEQLEQRMDRRNDHYSNKLNRHEIRTNARQERTDAWYDHHMH